MSAPRVVLDAATSAADAQARLTDAGLPGAPVVDDKRRFIGTVSRERLAAASPASRVGAVADTTTPTVPVDAVLEDVVELLARRAAGWVTVLDGNHVAGVVAASDVVRGYRHALRRTLQRIGGVGTRTVLLEQPVLPGSVFADRTVGTVEWPPGTFVVSVQRGDELLFPEPDTALRASDVVSLLVRSESADAVRVALAHTTRDIARPKKRGPEFV